MTIGAGIGRRIVVGVLGATLLGGPAATAQGTPDVAPAPVAVAQQDGRDDDGGQGEDQGLWGLLGLLGLVGLVGLVRRGRRDDQLAGPAAAGPATRSEALSRTPPPAGQPPPGR